MKKIIFKFTIITTLILSVSLAIGCGGEGEIACIPGVCNPRLRLNAELIPKCTADPDERSR